MAASSSSSNVAVTAAAVDAPLLSGKIERDHQVHEACVRLAGWPNRVRELDEDPVMIYNDRKQCYIYSMFRRRYDESDMNK